VAGAFATTIDGFAVAWSDPWRRARASSNPFEVYMVPPFAAHDGQSPRHFITAGHIGATAIKKGSPERVKELLRILNWLAAPFGSQEERLVSYGVEGVDYNLDSKGNPILTEKGNPDANYLPFKFVAFPPVTLYLPDIPDYARVVHEAELQIVPIGVADPTIGYISPTSVRQGVVLNTSMADASRDIIAGRRPLSDWDTAVQGWRDAGGEQIRTEYLQQFAATGR
jgi:putative aldouronate transport system substrate-binding protein